jgi:hypothetical protein
MRNFLIYMFMFTWFYIIYNNNFNKNNINSEPLHILFNDNNDKYIMINIQDIIDPKLSHELSKELDKINYFNTNKYVGINYLNIKEPLFVIHHNYLKKITDNILITGVLHKIKKDKYKLVPFKTKVNPGIIKSYFIKNKIIDLNNQGSIIKKDLINLYLKNIYNYQINDINIPIYLLSNNLDKIKVSMKVY